MANSILRPKVVFTISLELDEDQARALAYISDFENTLMSKALAPSIGETFKRNHATAIDRLMLDIRDQIRPQLKRVDRARAALLEVVEQKADTQ